MKYLNGPTTANQPQAAKTLMMRTLSWHDVTTGDTVYVQAVAKGNNQFALFEVRDSAKESKAQPLSQRRRKITPYAGMTAAVPFAKAVETLHAANVTHAYEGKERADIAEEINAIGFDYFKLAVTQDCFVADSEGKLVPINPKGQILGIGDFDEETLAALENIDFSKPFTQAEQLATIHLYVKTLASATISPHLDTLLSEHTQESIMNQLDAAITMIGSLKKTLQKAQYGIQIGRIMDGSLENRRKLGVDDSISSASSSYREVFSSVWEDISQNANGSASCGLFAPLVEQHTYHAKLLYYLSLGNRLTWEIKEKPDGWGRINWQGYTEYPDLMVESHIKKRIGNAKDYIGIIAQKKLGLDVELSKQLQARVDDATFLPQIPQSILNELERTASQLTELRRTLRSSQAVDLEELKKRLPQTTAKLIFI